MRRMNPAATGSGLNSTLLHCALLVVVAVAAYANSFQVPFVFDDETSITKNYILHDLSNFTANRSGYDSMPNRYVAYLSFALNYHLGGTNVLGYHIVNLLIHILNGLLVYALLRNILGTPFFAEHPGRDPQARWWGVPLMVSLLFISHPVQTQAVTYIVQRLTSLATFFFLASFLLHLRWRLNEISGSPFRSMAVALPWCGSFLAAALAMKTKEIAFTLPATVLICELTFFGRPRLPLLAKMIPLVLTMAIIPWTMLSLHQSAGEVISDVSKVLMAGQSLPRWQYLFTQFSVIVTYIRLLLVPVGQNLDYDYAINLSLLEPRTLGSLALLLAILCAGWYCFRRSRVMPGGEGREPLPLLRLVAFGIVWFFLTLSVESSIIPITDVIFEHRIYLPSVGFFTALAALAGVGFERWGIGAEKKTRAAVVMVSVVVLSLTVATLARNAVWQSWETLWSDVKRKSPEKPRSYNNLGAYYVRLEKPDAAIREFEAAVRLAPEYLDSLYNLAMLYVWAGRYAEARAISDKLQQLDPETFRQLDQLYGNK